jgi:hypothetical protein
MLRGDQSITFEELADLDDPQLNALLLHPSVEPTTARFVREEQLLRQLSGLAIAMLADIFISPDQYHLNFDELHMVSRYLVNDEARRVYRHSSGVISAEVAEDFRLASCTREDCEKYVDDLYRSLDAGQQKPVSPEGFTRMAIKLGTKLYMAGDFEGINAELDSVDSPIRVAGSTPGKEPFLFVAFVPDPHDSPRKKMMDTYAKHSAEVGRQMARMVAKGDPAVEKLFEPDERQKIWYMVPFELARSPMLAPDANGINLLTDRTRFILVWRPLLDDDFFDATYY